MQHVSEKRKPVVAPHGARPEQRRALAAKHGARARARRVLAQRVHDLGAVLENLAVHVPQPAREPAPRGRPAALALPRSGVSVAASASAADAHVAASSEAPMMPGTIVVRSNDVSIAEDLAV